MHIFQRIQLKMGSVPKSMTAYCEGVFFPSKQKIAIPVALLCRMFLTGAKPALEQKTVGSAEA